MVSAMLMRYPVSIRVDVRKCNAAAILAAQVTLGSVPSATRDTQELLDGTDPFDEKNYRLHVRLDITDSDDGCCVTNLVAVSETYDDWQPSSVVTSFVGKQPPLATPYYNGFWAGAYPTNTPLTNIVFTLNTDCWMYGVDLSCMSVWSDQPENWSTEPVTLISPLHVMCASHVTPDNGTRGVFRSFAGDLFVRTLVDSKPLQGVADNDLCVGILDEPLPSAIKVARFLSPGYSSYIGNGRKLPYVRIGKEKQCTIEDVLFLSPTSARSEMIKIEHSTDYMRKQYQRPPISMDSGHPISLLFGDELAFLCPTRGFRRSDNLATGYLCAYYLDAIQRLMDFLSDTTGRNRMLLMPFDMSGYHGLYNYGGME